MPHIVLENVNEANDVFQAVSLFSDKTDDGILKTLDKYINASGQIILVEALAIENGRNQNFFIQLSRKKSSLTVRLLPLTDPEKTDGVKKIMAVIAKQIRDSDSQIIYGKTNLQDFLIN